MNKPNPDNIILLSSKAHLVPDAEETCARTGTSVRGIVKRPDGGDIVLSPELLGSVADLEDLIAEIPVLSLAFGPGTWLSENLSNPDGVSVSHLIDPTSIVPKSTEFGQGTFVNSGCAFGAASTFGENCMINQGCSLGHHLEVGDFVSFGPAATVMGDVVIGKGAMIGMNATVMTELTIGENAVIGAGAVVMEDVLPNSVLVGNPARVVKTNVPGYQGIAVT